jgi:uracil-DNA glycosylase
MFESVKEDWKPVLSDFEHSEAGKKIEQLLAKQKAEGLKIFPPKPYRALELLSAGEVKVVILGQDPYHGFNQANGLAFSVNRDVPPPPSLRNIFKEIKREYPEAEFRTGELEGWAKQGVLLLNTVLTVVEGVANSHSKKGWEELTDEIIAKVASEGRPVVFMLWGSYAQRKGAFIDRNRHCVLTAAHPSPLSADRGFFGCKHFSKTNQYFKSKGISEIEW